MTALATTFATALTNFCLLLQEKVNNHYAKNFAALKPDEIQVMHGQKYVRVVKARDQGAGDRHVYCFIDKSNGDILKPAGWKAPAKHARGNIYGADPLKGCGDYGVDYLR